MTPEWLWLGAAIAGYLLVMVCNPLRGFFVEAYDLIRGRGALRLWLPVAILSLAPVSLDWGAAGRVPVPPGVAVTADGAALLSGASGLRVGGGVGELPVKTRAALSIGAVFWAAWVIGVQFFVLVALYLRAVMPERDPGWKGLLDFAWRRAVRFWPGVLVAGAFTATSLWLAPDGTAALVLWSCAAAVAAVFAFVQVSLLSGDRGLGAAVRSNFECWRTLGYSAGWFLAVAAVHLFLLRVAGFSAGAWAAGKGGVLPVLWDVVFAAVRAAIMLWLLAAWVLFFCAKTKNPTRRRIRP